MERFAIPADYMTPPLGSDAERDGRILLEREAAAEAGTYRVDASEVVIGGSRHLQFRFAPIGAPAKPGAELGWLAIQYETSGLGSPKVSTGENDAGGVSYGAFQLTSRDANGIGGRVAEFLAAEGAPFRGRFGDLAPGSSGFTAAWKVLAADEPAALFAAEKGFILRTHHQPQLERIRRDTGLDLAARSRALQEVVLSTAIQHGPNTELIVNTIRALTAVGSSSAAGEAFDADLIEAIYDERARLMPGLGRYRREKADALRLLEGPDEGHLSAAFAAEAAAAAGSGTFAAWFAANIGRLQDFQPGEFLVLGGQNATLQLNTPPPPALWPNVISLARLLQAFRSRIGRPVVLTSVYRNADYNAAIGGAANSQHIQFRAADFVVPGFSSPLHWASVLRELREGGVFAGAIGTYAGFVHVDTRGQNIDFP